MLDNLVMKQPGWHPCWRDFECWLHGRPMSKRPVTSESLECSCTFLFGQDTDYRDPSKAPLYSHGKSDNLKLEAQWKWKPRSMKYIEKKTSLLLSSFSFPMFVLWNTGNVFHANLFSTSSHISDVIQHYGFFHVVTHEAMTSICESWAG